VCVYPERTFNILGKRVDLAVEANEGPCETCSEEGGEGVRGGTLHANRNRIRGQSRDIDSIERRQMKAAKAERWRGVERDLSTKLSCWF
jgi:hypothetical protein